MRITDSHVYFWGGCFSNFYRADTTISIEHKDNIIKLPTSEHAYMIYKAVAFNDWNSYNNILNVVHPAEAKKIGRQVKNFDQKIWDQIKYDRMYSAVYAKFSQNEKIKQLLLDTGIRTLVEASPIDRIWGVGLHYDDDLILDESNWKGKNLLGKVLMDVRQQFWDVEESEGWFEVC